MCELDIDHVILSVSYLICMNPRQTRISDLWIMNPIMQKKYDVSVIALDREQVQQQSRSSLVFTSRLPPPDGSTYVSILLGPGSTYADFRSSCHCSGIAPKVSVCARYSIMGILLLLL